ncbi:hypothetical protein, partial [Serratia sarumanii]|uniref:hypothetical protein n=1 Tax=Serratia sarumanii TaxID=3020826 RepID=UPI003F7E4B9B
LLSLLRSEGPQPSLWTVTEVTVFPGFTRHPLALHMLFGPSAISRQSHPVTLLLSTAPMQRRHRHV